MPRRLSTACLMTLLAASTTLTACAKKPSEAQCAEFADHMVELLEASRDKPNARIKKLAREKRQDIITKCVADGSVAEVECVMSHASLTEIAGNCK